MLTPKTVYMFYYSYARRVNTVTEKAKTQPQPHKKVRKDRDSVK